MIAVSLLALWTVLSWKHLASHEFAAHMLGNFWSRKMEAFVLPPGVGRHRDYDEKAREFLSEEAVPGGAAWLQFLKEICIPVPVSAAGRQRLRSAQLTAVCCFPGTPAPTFGQSTPVPGAVGSGSSSLSFGTPSAPASAFPGVGTSFGKSSGLGGCSGMAAGPGWAV